LRATGNLHRNRRAFFSEGTMQREFDVVIERDSEGCYVGSVPAVCGCHTQARSLDELLERMREVVELCLEASDA
jgi:predicted RNase H-like HicB family nuclease